MSTPPRLDWDPRSPRVFEDPIAACDEPQTGGKVAHRDYLGWSLFRHADVLRVLHDPPTFSSAVSARPAGSNRLDPPAHTA